MLFYCQKQCNPENTRFLIKNGGVRLDTTAIVLGVLDYIVKPVTARKVESALEKALTRIDNSLVVNQCAYYQELLRWFTDELERIAGLLYDRGKGSRSQIVKVAEHIRTYYDRDLTLFELAEIVKMTPAYFSNVFKQETGTTYIKYLTKIRMEKAKELLLSGYKVADVSSMVGYENYRYFCVVFKKYTGVTAQQFKGRK